MRVGLAEDLHTQHNPCWLSCWLRGEADVARGVYLFRQVYEWRQAAPGKGTVGS